MCSKGTLNVCVSAYAAAHPQEFLSELKHKYIHCSDSGKDKNHLDLNKNIHTQTFLFITPAHCAQAYLHTR